MPPGLTVHTPTLEIGYEAHGDAAGFPIVLLHGFPDDIHAWDTVAPPLTAAGYRVLVPYLRGYGTTRFLDAATPRRAQQAAVSHRKPKYPYLVGGGRMRCGCCKTVMGGTGSKARRYYRCSYASTGVTPACRRHVNAVRADRDIWDAVCDFVRQPQQVLALMESALRGDTPSMQEAELAERERELTQVQAEIRRWEAAYGSGAITLENFQGKLQRLEREVAALQARLGLLRELQHDLAAWQEERRSYEAWLDGVATTLDELQTLEERQWLMDALGLRVIYTKQRAYRLSVTRPKRGNSSMAGAGHFMPREKPQAVVDALLTLLRPTR